MDKETMISMALERSTSLQILELNLLAANRAYKLGTREWLPKFEVSFGNDDSVTTGRPDTRTKRVAVTLTQTVYNGGRSAAARKIEAHTLGLQRESIARQREELTDSVRDIYFQTLVLEEQSRLRKETFDLIKDQYTVAETEAGMGLITKLDLLETKLELSDYEITLLENRRQLQETYFQIRQLLSIPKQFSIRLEGGLEELYRITETALEVELLAAVAGKHNAALRTLAHEVDRMEQQLKALRLDFIPAIDLSGSLFIQGETFPLQEPGFSIKLNFSIPSPVLPLQATVSAGSRMRNQRDRGYSAQTPVAPDVTFITDRKAQALSLQAKRAEYDDTLESLGFQLEMAIESYTTAWRKYRLELDSLGIREQRLHIMEEQAKIGQIRRLDFVEAQIETAESKILLLELLLELYGRERGLEKLCGIRAGELRLYIEKEGTGEL